MLQIASALFGEPPKATMEEANRGFLHVRFFDVVS